MFTTTENWRLRVTRSHLWKQDTQLVNELRCGGVKAGQIGFDFESVEEAVIPHYERALFAYSGCVRISAPAEALVVLYNGGLGSRRTMGFGMVGENVKIFTKPHFEECLS